MNPIARWRKRRNCFHHDWRTGTSWITDQMINGGAGKIFVCSGCDRAWFV